MLKLSKVKKLLKRIYFKEVKIVVGYASILLIDIGNIHKKNHINSNEKQVEVEYGDYSLDIEGFWQIKTPDKAIVTIHSPRMEIENLITNFAHNQIIYARVENIDNSHLFIFDKGLEISVKNTLNTQGDDILWSLLFRRECKTLVAHVNGDFTIQNIKPPLDEV